MASYNRVILMGNLTRDVQVKYTTSGTPVTEVGLAVNDRRKNSQGEWVDEVTFVDVTFWGRTAEVAGQYLSKGSPVFIEGRLKLDSWEKDGQKNYKLRVVCERMQLLSSGGQRPASPPPAPHNDYSAPRDEYAPPHDDYAPSSSVHESDNGVGEIPF